jgi:hypothetical protein
MVSMETILVVLLVSAFLLGVKLLIDLIKHRTRKVDVFRR